MSRRSWNLSNKQKEFLESEGIDPEKYRIVGTTASDYVFYNTVTEKLLSLRR